MPRPSLRTHQVLEIAYDQEPAEEYDALLHLFEMGSFLVREARMAQGKFANSYRDLRVGACPLVTHVAAKKVRAYFGFNHTPFRGADKHCAEMRSWGKATGEGFSRRDAIVIAAPSDPDKIYSVHDYKSPLLLLCDPCIDLAEDSTVVVSVADDEDTYMAHTGRELKQRKMALQKATKKQRMELVAGIESVANVVVDPSFTHWTGQRAVYETAASAIQATTIEGLRMARAELAVSLLRESAA